MTHPYPNLNQKVQSLLESIDNCDPDEAECVLIATLLAKIASNCADSGKDTKTAILATADIIRDAEAQVFSTKPPQPNSPQQNPSPSQQESPHLSSAEIDTLSSMIQDAFLDPIPPCCRLNIIQRLLVHGICSLAKHERVDPRTILSALAGDLHRSLEQAVQRLHSAESPSNYKH